MDYGSFSVGPLSKLPPSPAGYPLGEFRPFDDPTWSDPLWWRYNILRHRYVEPLHPDDFIEGRYTETLMALTGITSSDAFFDERNRAIQEVAERLRQQILDGVGNQILQQMALTEAIHLLDMEQDAGHLLGIASTFDDVFPRSLLLTIAKEEQIRRAEYALDYLITNRLLLAGDRQQNLWLSPTFRNYIYQQQPTSSRQRRHRMIARHYAQQKEPLATAIHWQNATNHEQAAAILFNTAEELINELRIPELIQILQRFEEHHLQVSHWREVQILLSDLCYRTGEAEDAIAACRRALKAATEDVDLARIYRRMGKLYVTRNQLHALGYYQQAADRFALDSPELADLLKDRGWLHILRRNWDAAEGDLNRARAIAPKDDAELQADIADAQASLYRRQKRLIEALEFAQQALSLREQSGNLPRIASSFNNLGITYRMLGEFGHAIGAYEEAFNTYQKLGNQEGVAGARMNIGSAYFLMNRLDDAIHNYQQSLEICTSLGQPHVEATVHYNLAEAYAAMKHQAEALNHWQRGYDLSQRAGFTDEIQAFEQLRAETPLLQEDNQQHASISPQRVLPEAPAQPVLPPDEQAVLDLAQRYSRITAKLLTEELVVSRATATRRLSALAEDGHLTQHGKGRGTYYTLTDNAQSAHSTINQILPSSDEPTTGPKLDTLTMNRIAQLIAQDAALQERFGVSTIMPMSQQPTRPQPQLRVQFTQVPTLSEFWSLRTYLAELVGMDLDLHPDL